MSNGNFLISNYILKNALALSLQRFLLATSCKFIFSEEQRYTFHYTRAVGTV